MARFTPIQTNFNAGEWSPRMGGRTDLDTYGSSSAVIENFDMIPQGGLVRRSGTRHVAAVKTAADKTVLFPFEVSDVQSYIIEAGDFYFRFYTNEAQLLAANMVGITGVNVAADEFFYEDHGHQEGSGPLRFTTTGAALPAGITAGTDYYIKIPPTLTLLGANSVGQGGDVDFNNDLFDLGAVKHDLSADMGPFRFTTTGKLPNGILPETDYYILMTPASTDAFIFDIALTVDGTLVTFSDAGYGVHTMTPTPEYARSKFRVSLADPPIAGDAVDITDAADGVITFQEVTQSIIHQVSTPYGKDIVGELSIAQSADVLYIAHRLHRPRKLSRKNPNSFVLDEVDFEDGPYLDENITAETFAVAAIQNAGTYTTLTSSLNRFKLTDIGRQFRLKSFHATTGNNHWGYGEIVDFPSLVSFIHADFSSGATHGVETNIDLLDDGNDYLTTTGVFAVLTGLVTGTPIRLDDNGNNLPTGLVEGKTYYARAVSATQWSLHPTRVDATSNTKKIAFTTGPFAGAIHAATCEVTFTTHNLSTGEGPFTLESVGTGATLPPGFLLNTNYWIHATSANVFEILDAQGGTSPGSGSFGAITGRHVLRPATTDVAGVMIRYPFSATVARASWRMGAWADESSIGYPGIVSFHAGRLWWASNTAQPQTLWSSKSGKFETMSPTGIVDGAIDHATAIEPDLTLFLANISDTVADDNSIVVTIASNTTNVITWLSSQTELMLGTAKATWTIEASSAGEALSPSNVSAVRNAGDGAKAGVETSFVGDRTVFVGSTGFEVHALGFTGEAIRANSDNLTLLSEHITVTGIDDLTYAPSPFPTLHCARGDGQLASLTMIAPENIQGWTRRIVGGDSVGSPVAAAATFTPNSTFVSTQNNTITIAAHGFLTGTRVIFKVGSGTLPLNLLEHRSYWLNAVDFDTIAVYDTEADALADSDRIDFDTTGSGSDCTIYIAADAAVESVATIPAPAGDLSVTGRTNRPHDQTWCVVRRFVDNAEVRHIEFFEDLFEDDDVIKDGYFVDGGKTYNGAASAGPFTLAHLPNQTVHILADGEDLTAVLDGTGAVTLATAASTVHIGLPYNSNWRAQRMEIPGDEGTRQMAKGRIDHLTLRLLSTLGLKVGPDKDNLSDHFDLTIPTDQEMDVVPAPFNGDVEVELDAPWEKYLEMYVRQDRPLPMSLLAVLAELQKSRS